MICKSQGAHFFGKLMTDLEEALQTLANYVKVVSEMEKIQLLHEKVNTNNAGLNASVMAILMCPDIRTFLLVMAEVNVVVQKFFPMKKL
jgi:hypothetical protein